MSHRSSKSSLGGSQGAVDSRGAARFANSPACPLPARHRPHLPCLSEARKLMRSRTVREERSGEGAVGRRSADEGGGGGSGRVGSGWAGRQEPLVSSSSSLVVVSAEARY
ncbi:unnamed protein product [Calypogeia fissa]